MQKAYIQVGMPELKIQHEDHSENTQLLAASAKGHICGSIDNLTEGRLMNIFSCCWFLLLFFPKLHPFSCSRVTFSVATQ